MKIFVVARDVTGLELASDVQDIEEVRLREVEEMFTSIGDYTTLTLRVGGKDRHLNVANIVEVRLEKL